MHAWEYLFVHVPGGMGPTLQLNEAIRCDPRWPSTRATYGGARRNWLVAVPIEELRPAMQIVALAFFASSHLPVTVARVGRGASGASQDQGDFGGGGGLGVACWFPVDQCNLYDRLIGNERIDRTCVIRRAMFERLYSARKMLCARSTATSTARLFWPFVLLSANVRRPVFVSANILRMQSLNEGCRVRMPQWAERETRVPAMPLFARAVPADTARAALSGGPDRTRRLRTFSSEIC